MRRLFGFLVIAVSLIAVADTAKARYASIVIDAETGQVLHGANQDTRNYPASLTKMMTLYMAFEALENGTLTLDKKLKVSRRAAGMPPSKLGLKAGKTIRAKDVILALVTKSANDAAVVMAEALGGKETQFARMMTKKARALGMKRTSFRNASGLPNRGQLSTARDMSKLAQALLRDFPSYYSYFSTKSFTYAGRTYRNHNKLLKNYKGTDGIKTGYIRASGFNLVASVKRNNRRLIAVVFGGRTSRSRDRHIKKLLDRGFTKLAEIRIAGTPPVPRRKPVSSQYALNASDKNLTPAVSPVSGIPIVTSAGEPLSPTQQASLGTVEQGSANAAFSSGNWGVQVGAFSRAAPAQQAATLAAHSVPQILSSKPISVLSVDGLKGTLFRARVGDLNETSAREACRQLTFMSFNCVVVPPGSS
ncbi:D-alanyl-D-alanine carboxypeptidase [Pelagibius sp. Alg239-R121]|uniref:D-alanyl-D-alanine carboxypeptidase n=1 Tax=Pelagibius sp. Alg239-R121 TaxID=2993448 RepID=UPI0024A63998|nr:D-alanyl-D-alanine carboxypeptidase [Pelagibius sp. Alg239-R121]